MLFKKLVIPARHWEHLQSKGGIRAGPGETSAIPEGREERLRQKGSQKHSQGIGNSLVRPAD